MRPGFRRQKLIHTPFNRRKIVPCHQPLTDALLIGDDNDRHPGVVQPPDCRCSARQKHEILCREQVAAGDMRVQHPVPVQKHGFRLHQQEAIA